MKWVKAIINGHEVSVGFDENSIHVYNAYFVKDDLKLRGYRWNAEDKSWTVSPRDVDEELAVLQNDLKPAAPEAAVPVSGDTALDTFPPSHSVLELRHRIDRLIREGIRGSVWIRGVIASEVKTYAWASYFDLRDEDDQAGVFFRMEVRKDDLGRIAEKLRARGVADSLEKDLPVFLLVEVRLSLRHAVDVRLTVRDILPEFTQARIRNQRDVTLDTLRREGILDRQKHLALPTVLSRLGLITSELGTSIRDIRAGLGVCRDRYQVLVVDTRMEGSGAVASLLRALGRLERLSPAPEAVIIARGGGSEQSLAVFNDLELCRRVCLFPLPVLTAIGHEKDLSAIEICSHLTPVPATPSGLGHHLQQRFLRLQSELFETVGDLVARVTALRRGGIERLAGILRYWPRQGVALIRRRREGLLERMHAIERSAVFMVRAQQRQVKGRGVDLFQRTRSLMVAGSQTVLRAAARLDFAKRGRENRRAAAQIGEHLERIRDRVPRRFTAGEREVVSRGDLVRANDPALVLKRGFTLTLDPEDRVMTDAGRFRRLGRARLKFRDGIVPIRKEEDKP